MGPAYVTNLLGVSPLSAPSSWEEAARLVEFHGLEGLAVARSREAGSDPLPGELAWAWEGVYRMQGLRATLLLEGVGRAREALAGAGIGSVLFKGAALVADGTYPDPGARRMDDADLLVAPGDVPGAVEVLGTAGFRPVTGWSGERMGWVDAVTLHDTRAPGVAGVALDLHWRTEYDRLRFGGGGMSRLWAGADRERGLPAPEAHLVVVAEHLLKHLRYKVHLAAFGDLARLARRARDWDRVGEMVAGSRLERGLRALLAVLARDLGAPVPRPLADGVPGGLCHELSPGALAGRVRPVEGRLGGIAHRWLLLGTPGRVAADLAEAGFPPGAWLEARYGRGGVGGWARYVADVARWSAYRGRSPTSPNQELFEPRARE